MNYTITQTFFSSASVQVRFFGVLLRFLSSTCGGKIISVFITQQSAFPIVVCYLK